jgi:hypothetical protein
MMLSIEVGLVLSFQYCPPPDPCPSPVDELENIMYIGKLNPAFQDSDFAYGNITVTIPNENVQSPTPGMIVENRVHLIGVSYSETFVAGLVMSYRTDMIVLDRVGRLPSWRQIRLRFSLWAPINLSDI